MGAIKLSPGVESAMNGLIDEDSDLSIEERFASLANEIMANAYTIMRRQARYGKPKTDSERKWQEDAMEELKYMEKVLNMAKKHGIYNPKPVEKVEEDLMARIRKKGSVMGEIVANIPMKKETKD